MFSNQSAELSLNAPCRSIAAVTADRSESRFLVGTCAVETIDGGDDDEDNNKLYVLRYHSDVNDVGVDASLTHPTGPIQHLVSNPHDKTLVLTLPQQQQQQGNSSSSNKKTAATLYKIPTAVMEMSSDLPVDGNDDTTTTDYPNYYTSSSGHYDPDVSARFSEASIQSSSSTTANTNTNDNSLDAPVLEAKVTLEGTHQSIVDMVWKHHPAAAASLGEETTTSTTIGGDVLTLEENGTITQWDISFGAVAEATTTINANNNEEPLSAIAPTPRIQWDPHHDASFAVTWGKSLHLMDLKSQETTLSIKNAHRYGVTGMDYNPNKPHAIATSGMDGLVHFWDVRYTSGTQRRRPVLTARGGHSHYATCATYNPFHDQLLLSAGTDAVVNLWRVSTISSAPLLTLDDDDNDDNDNNNNDDKDASNVRVARHESTSGDAVYGVAWSAADAWLYTTVAYDGKVALHHVPSKEKYKILL